MVKVVKKRVFTLLIILLTLLATSCDLLGGSLTQYVTEYTHNAAVEQYSFSVPYPRMANGTTCINPEGSVLLLLRNPMKYSCSFSYEFRNQQVQDYYDSHYKNTGNVIQYTSMEADNSIYSMTFPAQFLEDIDSCILMDGNTPIKDISGTIRTFEAETHREFELGSCDLTLRADTVPQAIGGAQLQLDKPTTSTSAKYIVCFKLERSTRNYDFDTISINNDVWNISYTDGVASISKKGNTKGTLTLNPSTTPVVYPLEEGGSTFKPQSDFDNFYYYSNDVRTDSETAYNITITDKAGLTATARVSSKIEKMTPIVISQLPVPGVTYTADKDGFFIVTITHDGKTKKGEDLATAPEISCTIEDGEGNTETFSGKTSLAVKIPIGKDYTLTANASCPGYLSDKDIVAEGFNIIHSPQFFISADGDDGANGTAIAPFRTFNQCIDEMICYKQANGEPDGGLFINVLSDITPTDTDFAEYTIEYANGPETMYQERLVNNYSLRLQAYLSGKVTIRGVDENGNAKQRILDAQGSKEIGKARCVFTWDGNSTLTVENLTFKGSYAYDMYGAGVYLQSAYYSDGAEKLTATLKNCVFTENTLFSSGLGQVCGGAGLAVSTANEESSVTVEDCSFEKNSVYGYCYGAGIYIPNLYKVSAPVILKGLTSITGNSAETLGGGIYCNGNLILDSSTVTITENTCGSSTDAGCAGAGIYATGNSNIVITGATIKDNKTADGINSNLYLQNDKTIAINGNLNGSCIWLTSENQPKAEGDPAVTFATYTGADKPAENIFFSDAGIPISIGSNEAKFSIAGTSDASGMLIFPTETYDDICIFIDDYELPDYDGMASHYSITFMDSEGNALDGVEIKSMSVYCISQEIASAADTWNWNSEDNILTFTELFNIRLESTSTIPFVSIFFEYNGHLYSCNFTMAG